ncbi:MAG: hypothetical protein ACREYE_04855, partial [Gammaproteobacteria bacterium]
SGGARNPHVFHYTLRFLRSGGTRPSFARDGFFTNSQRYIFAPLFTLGPLQVANPALWRANKDAGIFLLRGVCFLILLHIPQRLVGDTTDMSLAILGELL